MEDNTQNDNTILANWIKVVDGKFTCPECENSDVIMTNTAEGIVEANLEQIKKDLTEFPTKVIYGICNVCGMEYIFRLHNGELYLEPTSEEK